jgi:hypothetical protein
MTTFTAWLPLLICTLIPILCVLAVKKQIIKTTRRYAQLEVGFLALVTSVIVVWILWRAFFIYEPPSPNWKKEALETNTALIFGFGFEEVDLDDLLPEEKVCVIYQDLHGKTVAMKPDSANKALYDQAVSDANYQYLIVQDGVRAAACDDTIREIIPMHLHNPIEDVNTLKAAKFAIRKMDSLHLKKAVVYAHDHQLARAVYDLKRVAASDMRWRDFEFIVPAIPPTPYPRHSAQWRTRCELFYFPAELFISRPRDTGYALTIMLILAGIALLFTIINHFLKDVNKIKLTNYTRRT